MWLSFERSFPLCGLLADALVFIITRLLLAAQGVVTRILWLPGLQLARARRPRSSIPSADGLCSLLAVP